MSRLKSLLHGAGPSTGNTQQPSVQVCKAVAQHAHTTQQELLHVVPPNPCNTQQTESDADKATEARRQRILAVLDDKPGIVRAMVTDTEAEPDVVIITVAIRGVGTADIRVPRETYDPFLLLELLARHNGEQVH